MTKEEFYKEAKKFQKTNLYKNKSEGYKNGFKDALFLAWQIIDESDEDEEVKDDEPLWKPDINGDFHLGDLMYNMQKLKEKSKNKGG